MPELLAISITKKDYRARSIARGRSVPLMMEDAMKDSLGSILADVKRQLPGKRLKAHTKLLYNRTPKGATARLVVGEGVPFANVQAKYGTSPTIIRPVHKKHLAIPMNAWARGRQNSVDSLMDYNFAFHPWRNKDKSKGYLLYYGKGTTPMFNLVKQVSVKPSVDLNEVREDMRMTISTAFKNAFTDYDFGYVAIRKGR